MLAMLYALFTFHWRARSIRQRGQAGFDDRYGPTVLAFVLLAAVIVNLVLRLGNFGNGNGKGDGGLVRRPGATPQAIF
jgi:hypothetical protein